MLLIHEADPISLPGSDHYFRKGCLYVRPYFTKIFQNKTKFKRE